MYTLTQEQVDSITDTEFTRGTSRLLPNKEDIPLEFWGNFKGVANNIYFRIIQAMDVGDTPPAGDVTINSGFTGANMKRFVMAHLNDFDVEYQHRAAGLAYALSLIVTITEEQKESS